MAEPRPVTCDNYWHDSLPFYLCGLEAKPFAAHTKRSQDFLLKCHKHLAECLYCIEGYRWLVQECLPIDTKTLALIGRNRLHLNEMINQE